MNIKKIITGFLIIACASTLINQLWSRSTTPTKAMVRRNAACPELEHQVCPDYCPKAERAAQRRISYWYDPLLAEELEYEYERLKLLCEQQDPTHRFGIERALAQQEMPEVD